ncbi:MAG: hypothetical protein QOJ29_3512 [Thermoleophilaceae bacterium]|nr:hypothetical protein [Thermoleophilaceae bacterium]
MMLPLAHAGHWLPDLLIYGGPVVVGILAVRYADRKERRKDRGDGAKNAADPTRGP